MKLDELGKWLINKPRWVINSYIVLQIAFRIAIVLLVLHALKIIIFV